MSNFLAIHHVSLIISSLEKSKWFYCDVLGLKIDDERPRMSSEGLWLNVSGQQQIHLLLTNDPYKSAKRPEHAGLDRHIALKVSDLTLIKLRLEKHNITFTLSQSGRKALFCHDLDGNTLEILE